MSAALALVALALAASPADRHARAREEIDRAMERELASLPSPRLTIAFRAPAGTGYSLEQVSFALDGKELPPPPLETLRASAGFERIFEGAVAPGPHELVVKAQYAGDFGFLSYMTGYKFKLAQKIAFESPRGLEIALRVFPKTDERKEWQQRLGLAVERTETMLAQIDTTEPERLARPAAPPPPPPPPVEPVPAPPAPEPVAVAAPAAAAAAPPAALPPAALPPPAVAAAPKRRSSAPAPAGPAPAAVAAAEPTPAPEPPPAAPAPVEPKLETAVQAVAPAPVALVVGKPAGEGPAESDGSLWYLIGGGAVLLVGILVAAARRKANPKLKE